jgi:endonuclease-3
LKSKAEAVCKRLVEQYGDVVVERNLPPIDELVLTILSQNTSNVNMYRGYHALKERYDSWEEVLAAPQAEVADTIRSSGFFRIKAERIQASLEEIKQRVGELDLGLLEHMDRTEALDWLTSLHGVGPKTASIVLLFCFGKPTLPVDTHVWRVTKRIGLIPDDTSREQAQPLLEEMIPEYCIYSLNHNLVKHGREICKARSPKCGVCFLNGICDYFNEN